MNRSRSGDPEKPIVRQTRNTHGTRVARAIVCNHCGASDTIAFAPRRPERALCRKCAANLLGTADEASNLHPKQDLTCTECSRVENTRWDDPSTFRCADCRQGIVSQQKRRAARGIRSANGVIRIPKQDKEST